MLNVAFFFESMKRNHRTRYILASKSPRRKILLKQIGLNFRVRPSRINETLLENEPPEVAAKRIALEKAMDVALSDNRNIVIGADTIVVIDGKILGKPKTKNEARKMLSALSGREHTVYTGIALVDASTRRWNTDVVGTKVKFRKMTSVEINSYVDSGSPMDKAGAYGIQDDYGAVFVERVNGCFYNVVGFPLSKFYLMLKDFTSDVKKLNGR